MAANFKLALNYYILKQSTNEEITGKASPQVDCLTIFQAQLINSWHLLNPEPKLEFNLRKGAVLTDVLQDFTINSKGFLISQQVKEILMKFHLMRHQCFPTTIKTQQGYQFYSWLHLCEPTLSQQINYKESVFYRTEYTFREKEIAIVSFEHYQILKSRDETAAFGVEVDDLVLSNDFDRSLDLFIFLPFSNNIFITERLKQALVANQITGFEFERTNKIRFTTFDNSHSA